MIMAPAAQDAQALAAYAEECIAAVHGPQLPCYRAAAIWQGFWERFGPEGFRIIQHAFGKYGGMWMGAPITVRRFTESNDEFFALPLKEELSPEGDL